MRNHLCDAAVEYASRGWRVIMLHCLNLYDGVLGCSCRKGVDCAAAGKHPVFPKWREVATVDPDKLAAWWRRWPRGNIGVLMGGIASLVCVDIDGDEGRESLKQLEAAHGSLPATRTQSTGRAGGGEHRIFHVDPFYVDWIKNRAKVAPGLDFRSEGGLIVAAPSAHASGTKYQWHDPHYPIAELPEWMFKLALSKREVTKELSSSGDRPSEAQLAALGWPLERRIPLAREALTRFEPAIQGQNGSLSCYRAAIVTTHGYCIPVGDGQTNHAFDLMWNTYNPRCIPPWNENELIHKIDDAERLSTAPWGFRLNVVMGAERHGAIRPYEEEKPAVILTPTQEKIVAYQTAPPRERPKAPKPPSRAQMLAAITRPVAPPPVELEPEDFDDVDN